MKILSLIPRADSTECAIHDGGVQVFYEAAEHLQEELRARPAPPEQGQFRFAAVKNVLSRTGVDLSGIGHIVTYAKIAAFPSGLHRVTDAVLNLLLEATPETLVPRAAVHAVRYAADYICRTHGTACAGTAFLVSDADILPEARLSGIAGIKRKPVYHAFSMHAAALLREHPEDIPRRCVVAHLGHAISVGAYDDGKILDATSPFDGEGPYSPSTSGTLPADALVELCFSGKYDMDEMMRLVASEGGLTAHLGHGNLEDVAAAYGNGDRETRDAVHGMAYRTAREIAAKAAVLCGRVDAILLTGPWALFEPFTTDIAERVGWIAPVSVSTWENEHIMLARIAEHVAPLA